MDSDDLPALMIFLYTTEEAASSGKAGRQFPEADVLSA
jgi:hypothetical protein